MNTSYAIWNKVVNKWYGGNDEEWGIQFTDEPYLFPDYDSAQEAINMITEKYEDSAGYGIYDKDEDEEILREHFEIRAIEWRVKEESNAEKGN